MKDSKPTANSPKYSRELLAGLSALAVAGRLLPHPANITPIGGLSVWGGTRLSAVQSVGLVLGSMFVTDSLIGFHWAMPQVYVTLTLITLAAHWLKPTKMHQIAVFTLVSSVVFFLTTNAVFYPWQALHLYPQTWTGQMAAYTSALPFLRNSMIGDIGYTAVFFGLEWATRRVSLKQLKPVQS